MVKQTTGKVTALATADLYAFGCPGSAQSGCTNAQPSSKIGLNSATPFIDAPARAYFSKSTETTALPMTTQTMSTFSNKAARAAMARNM